MPVFTFSTKRTKPLDTAAVEKAKEYCVTKNLNFSAVVTTLVKTWIEEQNNGKQPKKET